MVDTNTAVRASEASNPHEACKAEVETLARIGDKWTVIVVGTLSKEPIRYNEIHRRVEGISQRMLTLTLKGLEQDGVGHPHDVSNDSTPRGLRIDRTRTQFDRAVESTR
ncbi:transcriptional regulator, HxlR family [Burkholderia sp. D7]|nr:transcriptional regulator, HxlR family [Burkholderia sp. D7]